MTETEYGPGGYGRTYAVTPNAPLLSEAASTGVSIEIAEDLNPEWTQYAALNETDGCYVGADGGEMSSAAWRTKSGWGIIAATGLTPDTEYSFSVKARNASGNETPPGESAGIRTYCLSIQEAVMGLAVTKASSTVTAPSFMNGLVAAIKIGGKDLNDLGFRADRLSGLDMPKVVKDEELVPGGHIWVVRDEYFAMKRIVIEGFVHGDSPDDLRMRMSYLKSFLATFAGNPWRSTAPVRLERMDIPDRHWMAYYDSMEEIEYIGRRETASSAKVRVTMKCPEPYARSNETVRETFTPSAGSFRSIDLGNAPSDAVFVIKGQSSNPSFSVGDMVFFSDFSDGLAFSDVSNVKQMGVFSPAEEEPGAYRTTDTGLGILVSSGHTVSYTVTGNRADCSWVIVLSPLWQSSECAADAVVFEHRGDSDNYIRLYWDCSESAWVFRKCAGGSVAEASGVTQAFMAGTSIVLGITFDSTNAGGMKIFVNGSLYGANTDAAALAVTPATVFLHSGDGTMQPDCVFGMVAGWSRMLSSDEMLKTASDPSAVKNLNARVSYTGELDVNDLLIMDSRLKTASLFDVSGGVKTNVLDKVSGTIPILTPGRKRTSTDRTQTVIYAGTSMAEMEVRYRRRYL